MARNAEYGGPWPLAAVAAAALLFSPDSSGARELVFGPAQTLSPPVEPDSPDSITLASDGEHTLVLWCRDQTPRGCWARVLDAEGRTLSVARAVPRGSHDVAVTQAVWAGRSWFAIRGSASWQALVLAEGGLLVSDSPAPEGATYPTAVGSGGEDGALLLWKIEAPGWRSLWAARVDERGTIGEPFELAAPVRDSIWGTWDGAHYVVLGKMDGQPTLLWLGDGARPDVERTAALDLTGWTGSGTCIGSDGEGRIAIGWASPDGHRFRVFDKHGDPLRPVLTTPEPAPSCVVLPAPEGFRVAWGRPPESGAGGTTRAIGRDGRWANANTPLPGFAAAARTASSTLVAWDGSVIRIDDAGQPLDREPFTVAWRSSSSLDVLAPPLVAWTGSTFLVLRRVESGTLGDFVSPDGGSRLDGTATVSTGITSDCDTLACVSDESCAVGCWVEASAGGGGGQWGGPAEPAGPAVGILQAGRLACTERTGQGTSITDLQTDGGGFVTVAAGNPAVVQWWGADCSGESTSTALPREGRACALGRDGDALVVACLATGGSAWLTTVGVAGPPRHLEPATDLDLSGTWLGWLDERADVHAETLAGASSGDPDVPGSIRLFGLERYGTSGVAIAELSASSEIWVTAIDDRGPMSPTRLASQVEWSRSGLASNGGSVALAFLQHDAEGSVTTGIVLSRGERASEDGSCTNDDDCSGGACTAGSCGSADAGEGDPDAGDAGTDLASSPRGGAAGGACRATGPASGGSSSLPGLGTLALGVLLVSRRRPPSGALRCPRRASCGARTPCASRRGPSCSR